MDKWIAIVIGIWCLFFGLGTIVIGIKNPHPIMFVAMSIFGLSQVAIGIVFLVAASRVEENSED